MKVLMLGWELPPNNSGGLGVACLELSKALAQAGADIDFILPFHHEPKYDFMRVTSSAPDQVTASTASTVTTIDLYDSYHYRLGDGSYFDVSVHDQQCLYEDLVDRLADTMEFDIIHAHDWLTFRAAMRAREKKNVPLILHVHSIERDRAGGKAGNPWVREIEQTAMLLADHVFVVSQRTKHMIVEDYQIPADKIEVVHNSIDTSAFKPLEERNSYRYLEDLKNDGWKIVANIGRLTIQKGLPQLIETASEVVKYFPKTIFLIVGDGEQRNEILELAAEKQIARHVILTGFQRGKRWRDAYAIADLFLMPSVSEPFGLTPYEAIAYNTPSLISKQSGVAEVFKNCLKVDFWDINEMANQIMGVLRSSSLQAELTDNAYREFQRLGWQNAADNIMARYRHLSDGVTA